MCVCVSAREFVSNHQTCLCSVHWSLLLKPLWIFWLLKHSVLPLLTPFRLLAPCWTPLLTQNHHFTFTSISPTIPLSMITSLGSKYFSLSVMTFPPHDNKFSFKNEHKQFLLWRYLVLLLNYLFNKTGSFEENKILKASTKFDFQNLIQSYIWRLCKLKQQWK